MLEEEGANPGRQTGLEMFPDTPDIANPKRWLEAIGTEGPPQERGEILSRITDALILLSGVGYHAAYTNLQAGLVEYERQQGREKEAQERTGWIKDDANNALQFYAALETLMYETEDRGGPAGRELFPEIKKAARQLVYMAEDSLKRAGNPINLMGLRIAGQNYIPECGQAQQSEAPEEG